MTTGLSLTAVWDLLSDPSGLQDQSLGNKRVRLTTNHTMAMRFYVTKDYELVDPAGAYKGLSQAKKSDIMFDAMDVWERNMGKSKSKSFLDVVVKPGSREKSLGTVTR